MIVDRIIYEASNGGCCSQAVPFGHLKCFALPCFELPMSVADHMDRDQDIFTVSSLVLKQQAGSSERKSWVAGNHGKPIRIETWQGELVQRQFQTEICIRLNRGTWKSKFGAGMRIEIRERNMAALDADASDDEDAEDDSYGGYAFFLSRFSQPPTSDGSRKPQLSFARALLFPFKHVRDAHIRSAASSDSQSVSACEGQSRNNCPTIVALTLDVAVECFREPASAQEMFMKVSEDFADKAHYLEVTFNNIQKANQFLTVVRAGMVEIRRLKSFQPGRTITLRRCLQEVVGTDISGRTWLSMPCGKLPMTAQTLRKQLAEKLNVHPESLILFRDRQLFCDDDQTADLDGIVVREYFQAMPSESASQFLIPLLHDGQLLESASDFREPALNLSNSHSPKLPFPEVCPHKKHDEAMPPHKRARKSIDGESHEHGRKADQSCHVVDDVNDSAELDDYFDYDSDEGSLSNYYDSLVGSEEEEEFEEEQEEHKQEIQEHTESAHEKCKGPRDISEVEGVKNELMIEYLGNKCELLLGKYNSTSDEERNLDLLSEMDHARNESDVRKKILKYKNTIKLQQQDGMSLNAAGSSVIDLFHWKLAKYRHKLQTLNDGFGMDPDGDDGGTSMCSTDLDVEEPTPDRIAELQQESDTIPDLWNSEERHQKQKKENDGMQAISRKWHDDSPERMNTVDQEIDEKACQRKARAAARRDAKRRADEEIRHGNPELWKLIMEDRKLHHHRSLRIWHTWSTKTYGGD